MADKPVIDLDQMTVKELTSFIEAAEAKRRDKMEETKKALLDEFKRKAAEAGVSFESLISGQGRGINQTTKKLAVKYRGPKGETWSGRGKLPSWLTETERQGRKREEFLVPKAPN